MSTQETMTHQEWLALRRQYLGGSDAAAALGLSKWTSRLELAREKWGEYTPETTDVMRRGLLLEPLVADLYRDATGHEVKPGAWVVSSEHDWMAATPDLVDVTDDCIVQLKTASTWGRASWGDETHPAVPDAYRIQCHHEMAVCGGDRIVLCAFLADESTFRALVWMAKAGYPRERLCEFATELIADPDSQCELLMRPIARDEAVLSSIVEGESQFWHEYVLTHTCPPDDTIPPESADIIVADDDQRDLLLQLRDAKQRVNAAEDAYDAIVLQVKGMIGEASGIRADGICSITYRAGTPKVTGDFEGAVRYAQLWDVEDEQAVNAIIARETRSETNWPAVWQSLELPEETRQRLAAEYLEVDCGKRVFRPRFAKG